MSENPTYLKLVIQPLDLINAFKIDYCFASVIKWLTKWHIEKKHEDLEKALFYIPKCYNTKMQDGLLFAIHMYCVANGFDKQDVPHCALEYVAILIMNGKVNEAVAYITSIN